MPEPDHFIDTSALGRAFPDFSQGSSIGDDDDDVSIEIGRGAKTDDQDPISKFRQSREYSSSININLDDESQNLKVPVMHNHQVMYTPPLVGDSANRRSKVNRENARNNGQPLRTSALRNELEPSPPEKTKDYGSGESRKSSEGSRRTLSAMHARVRNENDLSQMSEERPDLTDMTVRNTRFGNNRTLQTGFNIQLPKKYNSANGLGSIRPAKGLANENTGTPQGTLHSFVMPEVPNLSELVSGVFEDGTPVFSRHSKSRATQQNRAPTRINHEPVEEVPVPYDEQAIFLSLKLLQDKVSTLEREKAEAEIFAQELTTKNRELEVYKGRQRKQAYRNDSALGSTDSEEQDNNVGGRQRTIQKNRELNSIRLSLLID